VRGGAGWWGLLYRLSSRACGDWICGGELFFIPAASSSSPPARAWVAESHGGQHLEDSGSPDLPHQVVVMLVVQRR
jgi:hypothetical protein